MSQHPIKELVQTAMESIKEMIDVNTIVGDPLETNDGTIIMPVSKVTFGFVSGGAEYSSQFNHRQNNQQNDEEYEQSSSDKYPFGGGSGAGVSVEPVAFMVVGEGNVKLVPVNHKNSLERVLDIMPDVIDKVNQVMEDTTAKKSKNKNRPLKQEGVKERNNQREESNRTYRNMKSDFDDETMN